MNLPTSIRGVAVPWVTAEAFPRLREISANPDDLPETYDEWLALVEPRFERHAANGLPLKRVLIDPDELLEWCTANDLLADAHGRAGFAAYVLMRRERAH
jgi:hypothetical protein